ncbi:DUF3971 domain-containing protein [Salipiger sp. IMCC34102]|uniref:YhdP family protein n=1 Tax=Salipiger sp. IMCC34102 TaxID=2510647 RepID=UPI00101BD47C|nr:DUF3971 domain-containing protein [Salipiger sp. IMCC34102]RYH02988.1 DUF3971 domain-containing protein [Salipiger sp. IMCC34102]
MTRTERGKRRRWPWAVGLVVGLLAVLALPLVGREIEVPDRLRDRIEARAAEALAGGAIEVGRMSLRLDRDLHPWLILRDTIVRDANGTQVVDARAVRVGVSPRGLVFARRVLVQDIVLEGLAAQVARDAEGRFRLAFDRSGTAGPLFADGVGGLVTRIDGLRDQPALEALERLAVDDLVLTFADARAGRTWTGTGAVALTTGQASTTGALSVTVAEEAGPIALDVAFDSPRDIPAARFEIALTDLPARTIAAQSPALAPLGVLDAPMSARVEVTRRADATLAPVALRLAAGAGSVALGQDRVPLEEATIEAHFDPGSDRVGLDRLRLIAGGNRLSGSGSVLLNRSTGPVPESAVVQLALQDLTVRPGALYPEPLRFDRADVDVRIRRDPLRIDLGQLRLSDGEATFGVTGRARATARGWDLSADLTSPKVDVATVLRLWPERLRPGTRTWIENNVEAGRAQDLTLALRRGPGGKPEVAATFGFADAEVQYLRGSPLIEGGAGFAALGDGRFDLTLDAGQVVASQGGAVRLDGSRLQIADLSRKPARLDLSLQTAGTVTASLALLNAPPLGLIDRTKLPVDVADGRTRIAAEVGLPLRPGVKGPDVDWRATGQVSDLQSATLVPGRRLVASALDLSVDPQGLTAEGAARLDGVPLRGRYTQGIGPGAARPQVTARVAVTPAALRTFGVALPPGLVEGEGSANLTLDLPAGGPPRLQASSDLEGLRMTIPAIGWTKATRAGGELSLTATLGATPQVERLSLTAPGLRATGALRLGPGGLQEAAFDRVRVANWFDGAVTLVGRGAGRPLGLRIGGGVLDLAAADLGGGGAGGGGAGGSPLNVRLDRLEIAQGLALTGFTGQFDTTGGLRGRFEADFNGAAPVQGEVSPSGGRTAVHIGADDAGAVLRAGGFLRGALGGTLDLTLLPAPGEGAFDGTLAIRSLRVRDAPGIAALLDAISVVGLLQQLDGQGIAFDEVDAQFRLSRDAVTVTQSSAVGPGLGISLDGIYRLASKQVDFQGVISPVYVLNGLGSFLTRRGEGLIGFNFAVTGAAAAPQVSVNPLSLFTPGMFRDIFRRPPPEVPN